LYSSESLITLSGKKLNKKRNLYNQFVKNNHYALKSFEPSDFDRIKDLLGRWESQKSHAFEHSAIYEALTHLKQLDLFCDLLIVLDRAVAFAIGTKTDKMGLVLFEKADTDYVGVYAAINTLFAEKHFQDVEMINRQEDLGIAELRKAKMSYNPISFVKKFTLTRNHLSMTEVNDLKALYHEAFNDSEGYLNYFFSQKYRADNVIFIKDHNEIVSALHLVKKQLICQDMSYELPFVVAAATRQSHRNHGLMKKIISQSFKELYNRKIALCALSPFDDAFYRPFGHESVLWSHHEVRKMALPGAYTYLQGSTENIDILSAIYQKKMLSKNIFVNRKLSDWDRILQEVSSDDG
jgi:predicted GNAT family N-acyltransferase